MPTASTAQILGNNESFEPYTSNIYSRRVLSGEFQVLILYLNCVKRFTSKYHWLMPCVHDPSYLCGHRHLMTNNICPRNFTKYLWQKYPNWFIRLLLIPWWNSFCRGKTKKITRHRNLSTKSMNLGFHWGFQQEGNWTIFHRQTKLHDCIKYYV